MNPCAFCGRDNDEGSQFCIDCGKSLPPSSAARAISTAAVANLNQTAASPFAAVNASAPPRSTAGSLGVRVAVCPHCDAQIDPGLPYCSHCGQLTGLTPVPGAPCKGCGGTVQPGSDVFCPRCGTRVPDGSEAPRPSGTATYQPRRATHKVVVLGPTGEPTQTHVLDRGEMVVGRSGGDVRFPDDVYMSPLHAHLSARNGSVWVRDLGSRNGTWVFIDGPCRLTDGDTILIGSQLLRFRRLGYPGPHPPEADATRRLGSMTPGADVAVLMQLRADGSHRDVFHLTPGRRVFLGREEGDWVFPYDQTMSGRHAEIRSEDSEFVLADAGSRNGVAVAVRGDREARKGQRVLVGDQVLRVETV